MHQNQVDPEATRSRWRDVWPVAFVFLISIGATIAVWRYESWHVEDLNQLQFERASQNLNADLRATLQAYGQFLRGGVGLFQASESVSRADWATFVDNLAFEETYPGIQGISYNAVLRNPEERIVFEQSVRANDLPDFTINPTSDLPLSVPVLYLEPLNERNQRAIGFDIYTEERRRAAIDSAIETASTRMTAKVTLRQEDPNAAADQIQAGVLLMLPVFDEEVMTEAEELSASTTSGMIVSVFRIGDLMQTVTDRHDSYYTSKAQISLYDAPKPNEDAILYRTSVAAEDVSEVGLYTFTESFDVFGRTWTLVAQSTKSYDAQVRTRSPATVATAGVLMSIFLTALVWAQSRRVRESEAAAAASFVDQSRIQMLLREVSHRSKNMLAVVRVIARQTAASHPDEFIPRFSKRIESLAASQDLLVRSDWKGTNLSAVIASQLSHMAGRMSARVSAEGPEVELGASAAQTIGMAIHELGTNAGKYGALSNDIGTVTLKWSLDGPAGDAQRLNIFWVEADGPKVTSSERQGFGTVVLTKMVEGNLSGKVTLDYDPAGLRWTLSCPVSATQA